MVLSIVRSPPPPVTETSMSQTKGIARGHESRPRNIAVPAPPPEAATAGRAFRVPTAPEVEANSAPVTVNVASGSAWLRHGRSGTRAEQRAGI